jgi:hypothetical protein
MPFKDLYHQQISDSTTFLEVPPRFELGLQDSKSCMLTVTSRDLLEQEFKPVDTTVSDSQQWLVVGVLKNTKL